MPDAKNDLGDFYRAKQEESMSVREDGRAEYSDMGDLEILTLPSPKSERDAGRNVETIAVRDLPQHIIRRVQQSFDSGIYIHEKPHELFAHYVGGLAGLEAVDSRTLRHLNKLSADLSNAVDQKEFFTKEIEPFLSNLRPKAR